MSYKDKEKQREYQRNWVAQKKIDNKEFRKKEAERAKRGARESRKIVLEKYGGLCECCKEDKIEFLAIDHIEGGGNKHRKELGINGGWNFCRWLIKNDFPSGYRILCHNCNQSIGWYGYCPHNNL